MSRTLRILVLGGAGFIGSALVARLCADGHRVSVLGRNVARARRRHPDAGFVQADLSRMQTPEDWTALVESHDVIVNCAGALQDGLLDDLAAVQERAMLALYRAASTAGGRLVIQISARLDRGGGNLAFLETKGRADAALKSSGLDHVILRPALVVGRNAHGGTALLRALAAFPHYLPLLYGERPVQTVALDDVAEAVARAVDGRIAAGADLDLAAEPGMTLEDAVTAHRKWLGLAAAKSVINAPEWLARPVAAFADIAGRLGWRSPLRSTAMAVMAEGVTARPVGGGAPFELRGLAETLAQNPAGVQDLWSARLYLLKAPIIIALSMFWLTSGLVPLFRHTAAATHFETFLSPGPALIAVLAASLLDVVLGLAVLYRPAARLALLAMIATSLAYLLAATFAQPVLWLDPLGPLVKVMPSLGLTLVALAILDER